MFQVASTIPIFIPVFMTVGSYHIMILIMDHGRSVGQRERERDHTVTPSDSYIAAGGSSRGRGSSRGILVLGSQEDLDS